MTFDPSRTHATLAVGGQSHDFIRLGALKEQGLGDVARLPFSLRTLLEALIRNFDGSVVTEAHVAALAGDGPRPGEPAEIPFLPGRVVLQDFTGVPCVVDLAAMRDAMRDLGGNPEDINPAVPCDLVIDHSVQVDDFATAGALAANADHEFARNGERYRFLKWGQQSLANFRVVPPATGIVHQVNLEYLARGCLVRPKDGRNWVLPDSLVGTDSHTTMINGLGVLGWGVGGIEAEAVMLGQPVHMLVPEVVGFRLTGRLPEGATATDLVLTVTQLLRRHGVVEKFVEFCGPGLVEMSIPDRATIANMAPEYGATCGFFPIDARTIEYLRATAKSEAEIELAEAWARQAGFFRSPEDPEPEFSTLLELDLGTVEPSLAGPRRPQDRIALSAMKAQWRRDLAATFGREKPAAPVPVVLTGAAHPAHPGQQVDLADGAVVIAAITSCTNTSNPDVMIAAGLVARKARALGLTRRPWVKTSLAPGSKVVTEYFDQAGLTADLEFLGFHTVGYGCTTCIGNSGPLPPEIEAAIKAGDLVCASVLSGNRNFEGRIHPAVRAGYLASPPLVVAYALAGTVDRDFAVEPVATAPDGRPVFLKEIWPTQAEIAEIRARCVTPGQFAAKYARIYDENPTWNAVPVSRSEIYPWDDQSTYIRNPPFFADMPRQAPGIRPVAGARCLCLLGDSVTTDHISPAGRIEPETPAGRYLLSRGVAQKDFNSYGSRRGNDQVMTRGTFANVRVRNRVVADPVSGAVRDGGWTRNFTKGATVAEAPVEYIHDAALDYARAHIPLVVLAGRDYGMGSSRDWAAKGTFLLGVRAVIAESFERIHRANLVFMGVLPLVFAGGQTAAGLDLRGDEVFDLHLPVEVTTRCDVPVTARRPDGTLTAFTCTLRLDTGVEIDYARHGGILPAVIRGLLDANPPC